MKTIGLIGGTTWLSTAEYYRIINKQVSERLGGANSAKLVLYSVNFEEFQPPEDWEGWLRTASALSHIAGKLEHAGADCLLLCSNTMHIIADEVQHRVNIPVLNIVEETAKEIVKRKVSKVALLGTRFTMEEPFFRKELSKFDITSLVPAADDREFIHSSIYKEFDKGIFRAETKRKYLEIINELESQGAEGVILGCTEIPLLIQPDDCAIPVFDTTLIHSTAAVDFALEEQTIAI